MTGGAGHGGWEQNVLETMGRRSPREEEKPGAEPALSGCWGVNRAHEPLRIVFHSILDFGAGRSRCGDIDLGGSEPSMEVRDRKLGHHNRAA